MTIWLPVATVVYLILLFTLALIETGKDRHPVTNE
jgi:hypothetical protein